VPAPTPTGREVTIECTPTATSNNAESNAYQYSIDTPGTHHSSLITHDLEAGAARLTALVALAVLLLALCSLPFVGQATRVSPLTHRLQSNVYAHVFDRSGIVRSSRASSILLVGNQCVSQANGNWNTAGTWTNCGGVVPTSADDVTINAAHTVTIDTSSVINSLIVNGTLQYDATSGRALSISSDVTIGGILRASAAFTTGSTTQTLTISGSLIDNGTFTSRQTGSTSGTRVINVTINGSSAVTLSGTASSIDFNLLVVNLNSGTTTITPSININFPNNVSNTLTLTQGKWVQNSNTTTISQNNLTITGNAELSVGGGTFTLSATSMTVNGKLSITSGTVNIGNAIGNSITVSGAAANLQITGGTMNVAGRWDESTNATANITGGTINVSTAGQTSSSTNATFSVSSTSTFTMGSGTGTVRVYNANSSTGGDIKILTSTALSSGTIIVGNGASTTGNLQIQLTPSLGNLAIDAGSTSPNLVSALTVTNTLSLTTGSFTNGTNLTMGTGSTISRSGGSIAAAPIFGTSVNVIYSGPPALTTGPEVPTSATVLNNLTMNKSGGVTLTANAQVNGVLTLTNGILKTTESLTVTLSGSATSTAASASSYVNGNLKKIFSSTGSFTFDVGDAGYSPVTVSANAGAGDVTANAVHGFALSNASNNVLERFWVLTNNGITLADLTFQWLAGDVHGTEATYVAFKQDGGGATAVPAIVNTGSHTGQVLAQTSFSTWTFGAPTAPTAVKLSRFGAESFADGVGLNWESGYEVDNLGYHVYRERNGVRERVTPAVVAGSALKVGPRSQLRAGYSYAWFDTAGTSDAAYYLESIDLRGERELTGPIYPIRGAGESPAAAKQRARLLGEPSEARAASDSSNTNRFEQAWPTSLGQIMKGRTNNDSSDDALTGPQPPLSQSSLPSSAAVKISVTRAGWYRVTSAELIAAGLDANADPRRLQLFVGGDEIPIVVNANGNRFESGDSVEFYGQALDTLSTNTQVYWLINGTTGGKRITRPKAAKPGNQDWTNLLGGSFGMTVERADKLIYFSSLLNGEATNIFGPVITSNPATQNLTVNNLDTTSTQAQLSVTLQGATEVDHQVQVELNGSPVGVVTFTGRAHPTQNFSVSRSLLHEGVNEVKLSATGGDTDVSLIDAVALTYAHSYRADNNALRFSVPAGRTIVVNGFSSSAIRVIDITNPSAPSEVAPQISALNGGYAFKLQTSSTGGTRTFTAFTDDLASHPTALTANQPSNLTTMAVADMLIVTHKNFRSAIEPLAAQRRSEGLTVSVVDIEDVYDEFSFGVHTPNALHDFLAWTNSHWAHPPRYLLLVGDSSWDPKDSLNQGFADFVPTKLIDTVYLETASDDWLTDFDGDGIADVATGRLPVRTAAEATLMVNKILDYEHERQTGSPLRGALLVADSGFESESNTTAALLPSNIPVTTINRADVGSDDLTRTQIVNNLNTGPLVANYFGHGSVTVWTGAGLLDSDLATSLTNQNRPTLFVLMTCLNGYSHDAYIDSLGESLLKAPQGGAMAVWASSGFTESGPQFVMSSQFYQQLFSSTTVRLGDGFKPAKLVISDPDVKRTWLLLGDPSMRLR